MSIVRRHAGPGDFFFNQAAERHFQGIGARASLSDHVARRHAAMIADVVQDLEGQLAQRGKRVLFAFDLDGQVALLLLQSAQAYLEALFKRQAEAFASLGLPDLLHPCEEGAMRDIVVRATIGFCLISPCVTTSAIAAEVTAADLGGKTICWSDGVKAVYGAGGGFSSNVSGTGTWSISGSLVTVVGSSKNSVYTIKKLSNSTFERMTGRGNHATGSYCN